MLHGVVKVERVGRLWPTKVVIVRRDGRVISLRFRNGNDAVVASRRTRSGTHATAWDRNAGIATLNFSTDPKCIGERAGNIDVAGSVDRGVVLS